MRTAVFVEPGLSGVITVTNLVTVKHVPVAAHVKDRIEQEFKWNAVLDAITISVITDVGVVTLGGKVHAW